MILRQTTINNNIISENSYKHEISFDILIKFLQQKIQSSSIYERTFPQLILERIQALQTEHGELSLDNIANFQEIFNYVYYLSSNVLNQEEIVWALGNPIPNEIFYGQKDFFKIVDSEITLIDESLNTPFYQDFNFSNKILYLLVLQRVYNLPSLNFKQLYQLVEDEVNYYYQLKIDFSFLEVSSLHKELPTIDLTCIREKEINSFEDIIPILASIDLKSFLFKGFSILKFINKTQEQAGQKIQTLISRLPNIDVLSELSTFNKEYIWKEFKDIVRTLVGTKEIDASFFPLLELNGVPILTSDLSKESIFFGELLKRVSTNCANEVFSYLKQPYTISYGIEENFNTSDAIFVNHLKSLGIKSYVCFPLRNKSNLVGFLELFSHDTQILDKKKILNVANYIPLIINLAIDLVSTFKSSMDKVILDKYTSLQEAVQWRFNQEAANYLSEVSLKKSDVKLGTIKFEKVFPVYGAIDVRNSTKLRNMAYKKDSYQRLGVIQLIVDQLESIGLSEADQKFIHRFNLVKSWLDEGKLDHYLLDILSFFQDEIQPFLDTLNIDDKILFKYKQEYLRDNQGLYGVIDGTSQQFEETLTLLNSIISSELELFNNQVQQAFPSYFEKFRTDGIEYDLYIGQSITPTKLFDPNILRNIRKQQIISMVSIARKTFAVMDDLPISLVTTQLVFIHPNPIDISFREDERRFDVEGGYNIRYEVIKKRIDKAKIKDTKERLVQPNKIAIVYSSHRIESEIKSILDDIATQGLINNDIEQLVLEELQGIEQLKAFRVTVAL